ncbi:hypothetical protein RIF29_25138 [Crotalaria pallida]|uniref:Uncharacterized protein n=1 Tax=Crotalaria pallida TaxID=3830 RepID=A0AAN9EL13_CROPI
MLLLQYGISSSIGDLGLKQPYRCPSRFIEERQDQEPRRSTFEASANSRTLHHAGKFVIFASTGLRRNLSNEEAVDQCYLGEKKRPLTEMSIKAFDGLIRQSNFKNIQEATTMKQLQETRAEILQRIQESSDEIIEQAREDRSAMDREFAELKCSCEVY